MAAWRVPYSRKRSSSGHRSEWRPRAADRSSRLIALGIPVLTADCHFWLHIDDIATFNAAPTVDGVRVVFDEVWPRRRSLEFSDGVVLAVPALPDLILTKRFGGRPKDFEDIRLLEALRREEGS